MMVYIQAVAVMVLLGAGLVLLLLLAGRFLCNYGTCNVTINGREPLKVKGGGKLLDTLYDNQIFIPSACGGQGTCGYCKVRVLSGGGPLLPTELPYLTGDEQAKQTRLACQVKIRNDIELEVKPEYLNVKRFRAVLSSATLVTADIRELHFTLCDGGQLEFRAGQYVQVSVPAKGGSVFRAYSIASTPSHPEELELLVRRIPGGLGSGYMHKLQVGDEAEFTGPYGEFELTAGDTELVCIGGGVGMAPMRSLIRHLAEVEPERSCWLFFGARTEEQLLYQKEFEALRKRMPNLHVVYALSEPEKSPGWNGETGFIHLAAERHLQPGVKRQAFLCGPPQMLSSARDILLGKELDDKDIFADEF